MRLFHLKTNVELIGFSGHVCAGSGVYKGPSLPRKAAAVLGT